MQPQHVIGLCTNGAPVPFVSALSKKLETKLFPDGTKPLVLTADLQFQEPSPDASELARNGDTKIRTFEEACALIAKGANVIALTGYSQVCFADELKNEIPAAVANIAESCAEYFARESIRRVGYLGRAGSQKARAVEVEAAKVAGFEWIFPSEALTSAIEEASDLLHDPKISSEDLNKAAALLEKVCSELSRSGAEVILPTCGYQILIADALKGKGYPIADVVSIYADSLCTKDRKALPKSFKIGIVGGLGPAATVDLYDKITKATPALTDQEHIKIVVEQNPQVPDRTKYLLEGGVDPTLALFAACRRLEGSGADAIVIACNTAHAFFESITPHLSVPLINMQQVTLEEVQQKYGKDSVVGLLATDGTIRTGIYSKKADEMNLKMVTPDAPFQAKVMDAIYGEKGAKAGFTEGFCKTELQEAARHLVNDKGATVLILGCTELPLILEEGSSVDLGGLTSPIIDPTSAIARRVVKVAQEIIKIRGRR